MFEKSKTPPERDAVKISASLFMIRPPCEFPCASEKELVKALAPRRKIEPFDASLLDVLLTSVAITFASARASAAASRQFHFLRTKTPVFHGPQAEGVCADAAQMST